MDLSPDDIVSYRFKQTLRGYAIDEVDTLLDRLADQVEAHLAELEQLRDRLSVAEETVAQVRRDEAAIQRALVTAQRSAERSVADATAQADVTLATATADADRIRDEAREEAAAILEEAQQLARREVDAARSRTEEAAHRHAEVLERIAEHRDALRGHVAALDELTRTDPPELPADPVTELVAGELEPEPAPTDDAATGDDIGSPDPAPPDPAPLRVRVHESGSDPSTSAASLGSETRDGG
ncbi:MAG: DivIVA domain-containing protein [Nitriliruptor sp.]